MARTLPIRLRTIAAGIVVFASGMMIWNAYQSIINATDETTATLPVIAADDRPFRVMPENPGGAEIPNQGSTIYNVLNAENADDMALDGVKIPSEEDDDEATAEPESLLGGLEGDEPQAGFELPELPEKKTESLYDLVEEPKEDTSIETVETEETPQPLPETDKDKLKEKLQQAIAKAEEKTENEKNTPPSSDLPQETPSETAMIIPAHKPSAVKAKTVEKAESPSVPTPRPEPRKKEQLSFESIINPAQGKAVPKSPDYYIQLGSLRSEAAARQTYAQIRAQFPALVRGIEPSFPQVDLGSRGVFTRIQVGPLTEADARKRCAVYTSSPQGGTCLVVSR